MWRTGDIVLFGNSALLHSPPYYIDMATTLASLSGTKYFEDIKGPGYQVEHLLLVILPGTAWLMPSAEGVSCSHERKLPENGFD